MFLSILAAALKGMFCFTGSYSNNVFPDPLSSEEEEYYIKKYLDTKDKDARNTLIEHNLRLVAHVVKKIWTIKKRYWWLNKYWYNWFNKRYRYIFI